MAGCPGTVVRAPLQSRHLRLWRNSENPARHLAVRYRTENDLCKCRVGFGDHGPHTDHARDKEPRSIGYFAYRWTGTRPTRGSTRTALPVRPGRRHAVSKISARGRWRPSEVISLSPQTTLRLNGFRHRYGREKGTCRLLDGYQIQCRLPENWRSDIRVGEFDPVNALRRAQPAEIGDGGRQNCR